MYIFPLTLWLLFISAQSMNLIELDMQGLRPVPKQNKVSEVFTLYGTEAIVQLNSISPDVFFIVFQIHSLVDEITISSRNDNVTGKNTGMVHYRNANVTSFKLTYNENSAGNYNVTLLVGIVAYDKYDPVPGGCNLHFRNEIAPYIDTSYTPNIVYALSQPPSVNNQICDSVKIKMDMYHFYLPQYDRSEEIFFNTISNMLTVEDIIKHGTKITDQRTRFFEKMLFSAYKGTGHIFVIVATYENYTSSSAYIPTISFACDLWNWNENCLPDANAKPYRIVQIIFGILVTLNVFSLEPRCALSSSSIVFFCFCLVFLSYTSLSFLNVLLCVVLITLNVILSWFLKSFLNVLSLIHHYIMAGFCLITICLFYGTGYYMMSMVVFTIIFILAIFAQISSKLWHSFVGVFIILTALSFFAGHFEYVFINAYRYITDPLFRKALILPPFQLYDMLFIIICTCFGFLSFITQIMIGGKRSEYIQLD